MSETSTGNARDRLADMTRERDGWRVAAMEWKLAAATWAATAAVAAVGLLVMGAVVAWGADPVRAQVQCMDPVRVINDMPPSRISNHASGRDRDCVWMKDGSLLCAMGGTP